MSKTNPARIKVVTVLGQLAIEIGDDISVALTAKQARELAEMLLDAAEFADEYE